MDFCTYIYFDPKTGDAIYVGQGKKDRPLQHLKSSNNKRFFNTLQKRLREGFDCTPTIILCPTKKQAAALEIFWIAVFGRVDTNTGTLFNHTDGGDGGQLGRVTTPEIIANISAGTKAAMARPEVRAKFLANSGPAHRGLKYKPRTAEQKAHQSAVGKSLGLKWWTNGVDCRLAKECPEGWARGRINTRNKP